MTGYELGKVIKQASMLEGILETGGRSIENVLNYLDTHPRVRALAGLGLRTGVGTGLGYLLARLGEFNALTPEEKEELKKHRHLFTAAGAGVGAGLGLSNLLKQIT